jgi:hypothetical protein
LADWVYVGTPKKTHGHNPRPGKRYRAYVILWNQQTNKIHIALSSKGGYEPVIFGGGMNKSDDNKPKSTALRELREESGERFKAQPGDLELFTTLADKKNQDMHFYYATKFTDDKEGKVSSGETCACIEISLHHLYNICKTLTNDTQFTTPFFDYLNKDPITNLNPVLIDKNQIFKKLPERGDIKPGGWKDPLDFFRRALFIFIKDYGSAAIFFPGKQLSPDFIESIDQRFIKAIDPRKTFFLQLGATDTLPQGNTVIVERVSGKLHFSIIADDNLSMQKAETDLDGPQTDKLNEIKIMLIDYQQHRSDIAEWEFLQLDKKQLILGKMSKIVTKVMEMIKYNPH